MRLRYARLTTAGPVRAVNEDWLDFWESPDPLTREKQGSVAMIADGVGGYEHGEVASRLAVEAAIQQFQTTSSDMKPYTLLRRMFTAACSRVHEASLTELPRPEDGDHPGGRRLPGRRGLRRQRRPTPARTSSARRRSAGSPPIMSPPPYR